MRSDPELLKAFRSEGDRAALEELFQRHVHSVFRVSLGVMRNEADAEDATQSAFLDAMRHLDALKEGKSFTGWIHRIAIHAALRKIRAGKTRDRLNEAAARAMRGEAGMDAGLAREVGQALQHLPEEYRLPVLLHHCEGLAYEEIAEALECPKGTVGTRIHRGLERLREMLAAAAPAAGVAALLTALKRSADATTASSGLVQAVSKIARSAPLPTSPVSTDPTASPWAVVGPASIVRVVFVAVLFFAGAAVVIRATNRRESPNEENVSSAPLAERNPGAAVPASRETTMREGEASEKTEVSPSEGEWAIFGRVLGPGGHPLEGAEVGCDLFALSGWGEAFLHPEEIGSRIPPGEADDPKQDFLFRSSSQGVRTDVQGRYRLQGGKDLPQWSGAGEGANDLQLTARHPSHSPSTVVLKEVIQGKDREAPDIHMASGGVLSGRIVDEAGTPLGGIPLRLCRLSEDPNGEQWARSELHRAPAVGSSDPNGWFELYRVPAGNLLLAAGGGPYSCEIQKWVLPDGERREGIDFVLRLGRHVNVRVFDVRKVPLSGILVGLQVGEAGRTSTTDAEGRCRFEGIPEGSGRLNVFGSGLRSPQQVWNGAPEVELVVSRLGTFLARPMDRETGVTVTGFRVHVSRGKIEADEDSLMGFNPLEESPPDRIRLRQGWSDLPEGSYYITFRAAGYRAAVVGAATLQDDTETDLGVVEMTKGLTLQGRVVDRSGRSVAGARIAAVVPGAAQSPLPIQPEKQLKDQIEFWHPEHVVSGTDGTFVLTGLREGSCDLLVWHIQYPPQRKTGVPVGKQSEERVRIELREGGFIEGKFGQVPDGLQVKVVGVEVEMGDEVTVPQDGQFRYGPLPAGRFALEVRMRTKTSQALLTREVLSVDWGSVTRWDPSIDETRRTSVTGIILTFEGAPAAGHRVQLLSRKESADAYYWAETDREGRFRIPDVVIGEYALSAFEDSDVYGSGTPFVPVTVTEASSTVEFRLPRRGSALAGRLVDAGRRPVPGKTLQVFSAGDVRPKLPVGGGVTGSEGEFRIERLPAGGYDLHLVDPQSGSRRKLVTIRVGEGETVNVGTISIP